MKRRANGLKLMVMIVSFVPIAAVASTLLPEYQRDEQQLILMVEEFAVTPTRHMQKVGTAPSVVTVITAEQMKNMGARNLLDVLRIVPGLAVYIARYGQGEIAVRGIRTSGTEKVRVMVDGHNIAECFMGSAMTLNDDLELDNVKQVEVVRGPGSALYGENAFVAVINVITKNAQDIDGTLFKIIRGTFDTEKYNVTFGKRVDKLEVVGALSHMNTDGPRLRVSEDSIGNSGRTNLRKKKEDFNLKLSYDDLVTRDDKVTLNTKYTQRERADYIGLIGALNDETNMDLFQFFGELSYRHPVGNKTNVLYKFYYDRFHEDIIFEIMPSLYLAPLMTNEAIGFEGQVDYELLPENLLTLGMMQENRKQYGVNLAVSNNKSDLDYNVKWNKENFQRRIWAVYLQDEWRLPYGFNLTLGGRYDNYSDFGGTFNPRIGLTWQVTQDATLKLLHGQAFRAPNSRELFDRNNTNTKGNPDLKPEKIKTTEASLNYRITPGIGAGATYFYNDITNHIVEWPNPTGETVYVFENKDGSEIQGVELELKAALGRDSYLWGNYSYQHGEDKDTGDRLPDIPSQKLTAGLNVGLWKYLNANIYLIAENDFPRAEGDSRDNVPGYYTVNLTLIAKEFFQTLEVRGSVYNLLNKGYKFSSEGWSLTNPSSPDHPQPGRAYLAEVSYKF